MQYVPCIHEKYHVPILWWRNCDDLVRIMNNHSTISCPLALGDHCCQTTLFPFAHWSASSPTVATILLHWQGVYACSVTYRFICGIHGLNACAASTSIHIYMWSQGKSHSRILLVVLKFCQIIFILVIHVWVEELLPFPQVVNVLCRDQWIKSLNSFAFLLHPILAIFVDVHSLMKGAVEIPHMR